ncbi:MAG: dipeptide epimerase [Candidatus Sphingomonas phytovorans]|nr:dipeptide epimerase [Sphingomonas sp.]WEK00981.1 MAG: dipeptide epimerase [Sphingomonas sp.]
MTVVVNIRNRLSFRADIENWELSSPVRITGYTFNDHDALVVTISDGIHVGRGEAAGVYYLDDFPDRCIQQLEEVRDKIEAGLTRDELRQLLPPGGARNAVDCALWELESRQAGKPVWALAGLRPPKPLLTTYTLSADTPEAMAEGARGKYADARAIKLKLLGDGLDGDRVRAVRAARDDVWVGVDANQGFDPDSLAELMPVFREARVALIEQPFKVGDDALLDGLVSPIPLAADESVQSLEDVAALVGRFQVMNIKLDKCGGLTEGLLMAEEARRVGLKVMIGNMTGTSLAMAPALLIGQYCDVVDLDGPLFLESDRNPPIVYDHGMVSAPAGVWGWSNLAT